MLYIYIGLAVLILIGTSIASSASASFLDAIKKRGDTPSSINMSAVTFAHTVIYDKQLGIRVVRTEGKFTDYYSSRNKLIAISDELCDSKTIVAISITAHELGHAIADHQHSATFTLHQILAKTVYYLNIAFYIILVAAIALLIAPVAHFWFLVLFYIMLGIIAISFLFKFITVSNEKLASRIGVNLLREYGATSKEIRAAKKIYRAAAITYVGAIFMPFVKIWRFFLFIIHNTIGKLFR